MSSLTSSFRSLKAPPSEWWPIMAGILILYAPTLYDLFTGIWTTEEQMHGPIILGLSVWLISRYWSRLATTHVTRLASASGWLIFFIALSLYIIGRSQRIIPFELGSVIVLLVSLMLIKRGGNGLKVMWFPLFFLLFMVPLPGTIVTFVTMPMKMAVSFVTENILYWAGYPIARNGVILQIGQYQLLVADACAGLQTLLTLEALGLFYLNIVHHTSIFRNVVLAILIVPISFTANVIRVTSLTLITYYFGDQAGQGFLHGFAGMVLFLSALGLILGIDALLQLIIRIRANKAS